MTIARQPLVSYELIINLIAATTTQTGLEVFARLDENEYPDKIAVTDEQLAAVNITRHEFPSEWNYTINHHLNNRRSLSVRIGR